MKYFCLFCWMLTGLPLAGLSQNPDSLPEILNGQPDWASLEGEWAKFGRKDLVRLIIATEGLGNLFGQERNDNYVNDFHLVQLNGDVMPDVVYCGTPASRKTAMTMVFLGTNERRWLKKFENTGAVCRYEVKGPWMKMVLREEANESQPLTYVRKYTCDLDSAKSMLTAEVCFLRGTESPDQHSPTAEELKTSCHLRSSPELKSDTPVDLDGDGKADVNGNIAAAYPAGTQVVRLAARTLNNLTWVFVMVYNSDPPETGPLHTVRKGFTFVAGWMEDECLK